MGAKQTKSEREIFTIEISELYFKTYLCPDNIEILDYLAYIMNVSSAIRGPFLPGMLYFMKAFVQDYEENKGMTGSRAFASPFPISKIKEMADLLESKEPLDNIYIRREIARFLAHAKWNAQIAIGLSDGTDIGSEWSHSYEYYKARIDKLIGIVSIPRTNRYVIIPSE